MKTIKKGLSVKRLDRITHLVQNSYVDAGAIVGAQVLVAHRGDVAYRQSFGLMDRERNRTWADNAVVRIHSMTKPIVSLALMMLWERGRFQLDDSVTAVLPELANLRIWVSGDGDKLVTEPAPPITFRQLLSHTAGLTYGAALQAAATGSELHPVDRAYQRLRIRTDPADNLDTFVSKLGKVPLRYRPGTKWMYSVATDVLGAVVQRLHGRPLDQVLRDEILDPLGMPDTGFHVREGAADRFAACYRHQPAGAPALQDDPAISGYLHPPSFLSGGGGMVSTISDYHRFCETLRCGGELDGTRLVGRRTVELMTANHLTGGSSLAELSLDGFSEAAPAGVGFGLGFAMTIDGVRAGWPCQGEYFWGGVASTMFLVDPREELVVIFLTQLMPSTIHPFRSQLRSLVYAALEH